MQKHTIRLVTLVVVSLISCVGGDGVGPEPFQEPEAPGPVASTTSTASTDVTTGLISHWTFDEGSGTTASDAAGSNDGTLVNGPAWTTGIRDGALDFDGVDDHVANATPTGLAFPAGAEFSFAAWLRPRTGQSSWSSVLEKKRLGGEVIALAYDTDLAPAFWFRDSGGVMAVAISGTAMTAGTWHHLAGVRSGNTLTLYLDGVQVATASASFTGHAEDGGVRIGMSIDGGDRRTDGTIDDVRIYGRTLSEAEVQTLASIEPDTEAPTVPANVTATGVSESQIDVSWDASTDDVGVAGYIVYRDGVEAGTTSGTAYEDTGLDAGTTHSYTVVAFDPAGNSSAPSDAVSATTTAPDVTPPTAPEGLAVTSVSSFSIDLSWTASTDDVEVTTYHVFRDGEEVGTTSETTYHDGGLDASSTHTYAVTASDAAGNTSAQSDPVTATTEDATSTGPTEGLISHWLFDEGSGTTAFDVAGDNDGTLTNGPAWVPGMRGAALDFDGVDDYVISTAPTDLAFSVGAEFSFAAWLKPRTGQSSWSSVLEKKRLGHEVIALAYDPNLVPAFWFRDDDGVMAVATGGTAMTAGTWHHLAGVRSGNTLTLYLDGVEVATAMETFTGEAPGGDVRIGMSVDGGDRRTDGSIDDPRIYGRALTLSEVQSLAAPEPDTEAPSVPANLVATAAGEDRIDLTWDPSSDNIGVAGYTVFRDGVEIATVAGTSYEDTGLTAETTYSYTVAAEDVSANLSDQSAPASATTEAEPAPDGTAPTVPTDLAVTAISSNTVDLSWTASTDDTGVTMYHVFRDGVEVGTTTETTFHDAGLTESTTHTYAVAASDEAGNTSAQSDPVTATTDEATSTGPTEGVISHWPFDEGSGTTAFDVGGDNDGTLTNGPTWTTGIRDSALDFDGVDDYVISTAPTGLAFPAGAEFSFAAWLKPRTGQSSWSSVLEKKRLGGEVIALAYDPGLVPAFWFRDSGGVIAIATSGTAMTAGTWHHLAGVRSGNTLTLYLDGVQVATATESFTGHAQGGDVRIGWSVDEGDRRTDGAIDDPRIYGHALTATEVQVLAAPEADVTAPTVPQNVVATAVGQTGIDVAWDASTDDSGVASYTLYRDGVAIASVAEPGYQDTGLEAGATHTYTVVAVDLSSNASAKSDPATATTDPLDVTPPSVPTDLTVTEVTSFTVDLSWTASTDDYSGVSQYHVFRDGAEIATTTGTTYEDGGLTGSSTHTYAVAASDNAGNLSLESDPVSVTTDEATSTGPTSGLVSHWTFDESGGTTAFDLAGANDATLQNGPRWRAGISGSALEFDGVDDIVIKTSPSDLSFLGTDDFSIAVWVRPRSGQANESKIVEKKAFGRELFLVGYGTDLKPTFRLRDTNSDVAILISDVAMAAGRWHHVAAVKSGGSLSLYLNGVQRVTVDAGFSGTFEDGDLRIGGSVDGGARLTDGWIDDVRIYGRSLSGTEIETLATPGPDALAPEVPTNLVPTPLSQSRVSLAWDDAFDDRFVAGYRVYRDGVEVATTTASEYEDTGLTPGATYAYAVAAFDEAGNVSAASAPVSVTMPDPDVTPPSTPTAVAATALSNVRVEVTWTASTDNIAVTGYEIFRDGVAVGTTEGTSFVDGILRSSTTYQYTVTAFDEVGNTAAPSDPVSVTTPAPPPPTFPGATWETRPPEELELDAAKLDEIIAEIGGNGVIVKDGYVARSWGNYVDPFQDWASAGKPLVSTLLFFAVEEGLLGSVDDLVRPYVQSRFGVDLIEKDRTMTFAHLANNTSGYGLPEAPGDAFAYNDFGTNLFIRLLFDDVYGRVPDDVALDKLSALQFEDGVIFGSRGGYGVRASTRDYARVAWFWLNHGTWNGQQVLPAHYLENYMQVGVPASLPRTVGTGGEPPNDYLGIGTYGGSEDGSPWGPGIFGYDWWFNAGQAIWPNAPSDVFMANGHWNVEMMFVIPSENIVIAAKGDWGSFEPGTDSDINRILEKLVSAVVK